MDSEVRRTLLKAPSTSVSAALVRPLYPNHRNTKDCVINHFTLFPHPTPCLSTSNLEYMELRTIIRRLRDGR